MVNIKETAEKYNFILSDKQVEQFSSYADFLVSENEKYNLTAITDPQEILVKHFIDSLFGARVLFPEARVVDIGSGAGFPGVPLKLFLPNISLTLLDSQTKKVNFLKALSELLELKDVEIINDRAEGLAAKRRESYDIAYARAVAELRSLLEYALPLVKVGGYFVAYKGSKSAEEIENARNALGILGGKIEGVKEYSLEGASRSIIIVKKVRETPNRYPRPQNKPKILPL